MFLSWLLISVFIISIVFPTAIVGSGPGPVVFIVFVFGSDGGDFRWLVLDRERWKGFVEGHGSYPDLGLADAKKTWSAASKTCL